MLTHAASSPTEVFDDTARNGHHGPFKFNFGFPEALARGTKGTDLDLRIHNGRKNFIAGDPYPTCDDFRPKTRVRILTLGADATDLDLARWVDHTPRKSAQIALVVDIVKSPTLDAWEDVLWAHDEKGGTRIGAVLLRPDTQLPPTFFALTNPLTVPGVVQPLGTWLSVTRNPKCNWRFPSRWSFPDWIVDKLPVRKSWRVGYAFADLSAEGLDSLLAEYAGLLDRGNGFQILPGSDLPENVASYLRWRYGGASGLRRQLDLWYVAQDLRTQGELSVHQPLEYTPAQLAIPGLITEEDLKREVPRGFTAPKRGPRRAVPLDQAEETIRDQVFMGSTDDPAMQNRRERNRTFDHNGRKLRKYHEGSTFLRRKTGPRVDDDPSPFVTCGAVSGRGDLRRRAGEPRRNGPATVSPTTAFLPVPEGLATFEEWDWTPTAEHLDLITAMLARHGTEYEVAEQQAGYWRTGEQFGIQVPDEAEVVELKDGRWVPRKYRVWSIDQEFCPLGEWNRHWDPEQGRTIPGRAEGMSRFDKAQWKYARGGVWLFWKVGEDVRALFLNKNTRPDSLPSRAERARIQRRATLAYKSNAQPPERMLAKAFWFNRKEGRFEEPRSFQGRDGRIVHLRPRPNDVPTTAWGVWKRSWTALQTVRQLLAEERWEYLAFDNEALLDVDRPVVLETTADEPARFSTDTRVGPEEVDDPQAEAVARVEEFLSKLTRRVFATALDQDVKDDFAAQVLAAQELLRPAVYGQQEAPKETTLADMNPPAEPAGKPKVRADNALDADILQTWRTLFAKYQALAKARPAQAEFYQALAARCAWHATGKAGPPPVVPPKVESGTLKVQRDEPATPPVNRMETALLFARAFAAGQSRDAEYYTAPAEVTTRDGRRVRVDPAQWYSPEPATVEKAHTWLVRHDRTTADDVTQFRRQGRVRYAHYRRLRRKALYGVQG